MIDAQMVWDAYRALHRYCTTGRIPHPSSLVVPAALSRVPVRPLAIKAAETIAREVDTQSHVRPLPVPEPYYTYLYLWAQLLRVSRSVGPHYDGADGWKPLVWRPLPVLAGSAEKQNAPAMWAKFYYQHYQGALPKPTELDLRYMFPVPPEAADADRQHLENQVEAMFGAMRQYGYTADEVFRYFDSAGIMQPSATTCAAGGWSPALMAARPETWWPQDEEGSLGLRDERIREYVRGAVGKRKTLTYFLGTVLPLATPDFPENEARARVRCGFADVVRVTSDKHVTKAWAKQRARFSPPQHDAIAREGMW